MSKATPHRCAGTRADGTACGGRALADSDYCSFHDPSRAAAIEDGRRTGGQTRSSVRVTMSDTGEPLEVETAADVRRLLSETVDAVRTGQLDPRIANTVGYLGTVLLRAIELDGIERRLVAIEASLSDAREARGSALARARSLKLPDSIHLEEEEA